LPLVCENEEWRGVLTFFDMKIGACVGRGIFVFVLFFFGSIGVKAQLWVEDFAGEADGATTGTAAGTLGGTWSVTTDPGGNISKTRQWFSDK
jgi:hypothetical protein